MRRSNSTGASSSTLLVGIGLLGAIALGWWFASDPRTAVATVDLQRAVAVERRSILHAVTASGRVEPLARVAVMSRASGILKAIMVEEGDRVEVGQVLAELDREQLEAQHAQDEADLQAAIARLAAARARLQESRGLLRDPDLEFARRELRRVEELHAQGNVSDSERDEAARTVAAIEFRLRQVEYSLPVLEASVQEAEAALAASAAALNRSATSLREATIRCPIDGIVLVRAKEVGDGVSSILTAGGNATQILTLGDLSQMFIDARVDEVDLGRIQVDMPAVITVDAHRGKTLDGFVQRIAPAGSVDNNGIVTFEVRITVEDPEGLLRPDMTATAKLVQARRDNVRTLPQRALRREDTSEWWVDRVVGEGEDLRTVPTKVSIGLSDGLITEILSGVEQGDRVIIPDRLGR